MNGTPFKSLTWRLLGVRTGRRLFDDGCSITEKTLVTIGDDCTLGAGSVLQAHSMEDGVFKADHITIGSHCTVGAGAFIHYGAAIADHAMIATDAFLMKGEQVTSGSSWSGNPARPSPTWAPTRIVEPSVRSVRLATHPPIQCDLARNHGYATRNLDRDTGTSHGPTFHGSNTSTWHAVPTGPGPRERRAVRPPDNGMAVRPQT